MGKDIYWIDWRPVCVHIPWTQKVVIQFLTERHWLELFLDIQIVSVCLESILIVFMSPGCLNNPNCYIWLIYDFHSNISRRLNETAFVVIYNLRLLPLPNTSRHFSSSLFKHFMNNSKQIFQCLVRCCKHRQYVDWNILAIFRFYCTYVWFVICTINQ